MLLSVSELIPQQQHYLHNNYVSATSVTNGGIFCVSVCKPNFQIPFSKVSILGRDWDRTDEKVPVHHISKLVP